MKPITILVGGDIAPTKSNYSFFSEGNMKALIDDKLLSLLDSVDYRIFNLEVPLTDIEKPIKKDGPNLIAPILTVNGIKLLNPTILGLANNHILDQDEQGLIQTMEQLSKYEINYVGAGKDLVNAAKPIIIEKDGLKVGIYACAENEFSIAEENRAGANPFDPLESLDHIVHLKSFCNFIIVLFHGGKEHYRYPSPNLQKVCRKMVEKGANLVICQHSHCIGAFEKYFKSVIVYGQGNFLFDLLDNEFWNTSLMVKATFGYEMSVDFVPIYKKGNGVVLPTSNIKEAILEAFYDRSRKISLSGFVETEYDKYCIHNGLYYLSTFAGFGKILRKIDRLLNGKITNQIYSLNKLTQLQNYVECEAHRELFLRYLRLGNKKNSL
jgi:poly-gamma-glutamate synthesis protein (capsule biosynthesis protein)